MNIPRFNAAQSIYRTVERYSMALAAETLNGQVVPQDCGFFKRVGCVLGPFSWCALAGLGGAKPFWDCVDKASGGGCLDCIGGADPRDASQRNPGDPSQTSGDYGPDYGGVHTGVSWSGNPLTVDGGQPTVPPELQKQLNRIERCARGTRWFETTVANVASQVPLAPWAEIVG
jgi:hypothetical protein